MSDGISTADLYDERGDELQSVSTQFQNIGGAQRVSGPGRAGGCVWPSCSFVRPVDLIRYLAERLPRSCAVRDF